jgi:hypothetical protein
MNSVILLLPVISGIIIAIIMRSIKAGIGTAALAGAFTFFVKSLEDGNLGYIAGVILCIVVAFFCFWKIYKTERREKDFKDRLGEYINTGREIWRNENNCNNQELEVKINEWTNKVAPDLLNNRGEYIKGKFMDEYQVKAKYKETQLSLDIP